MANKTKLTNKELLLKIHEMQIVMFQRLEILELYVSKGIYIDEYENQNFNNTIEDVSRKMAELEEERKLFEIEIEIK